MAFMKLNRSIVITLLVLVALSALYRIIPGRLPGFAPQMAIALFAGALFQKNKAWSFALPLASMFLSDAIYQVLYINGLSSIQGFYGGQWINYILIASLATIGWWMGTAKFSRIAAGLLAGPTAFFLVSNFIVWISGGGYHRPLTPSGLMMCYADGLPFYNTGLLSTVVFGAVLFGGYAFIRRSALKFA